MTEDLPQPETTDPPEKPAKRPGKNTIRERLDLTRKLLQAGLYDGEIKRLVSKQFGVARKSVIRYLSIVRKEIAAEYDPAEIERHRGDFLEFFRGVFSDKKAPTQARLRAAEDAVQMLGLNAPQRMEMTAKVVPMDLKASIKEVAELSIEEQQALAAALGVLDKLPSAESEDDEEGEA